VGTTQYYAVTAINDGSGEESLQSADAGSSTETSTLTWTALAGCAAYSVYKKKNGVYGFIGIAQKPVSGTSVSFTDATIVPDTSDHPAAAAQPVRRRATFTGVDDHGRRLGLQRADRRLIDNGVSTGDDDEPSA
jgi:hypothetical protein